MMHDDVLVVGSGATGAMASQTLAELGRNVTVLDVGRRDASYAHIIPDRPFVELRRGDDEQYRYFLGDEFQSVASLGVKLGAQLTPSRRFVIEDVERLLPFRSDNFAPLESLAFGGLASAWGLACAVFSPAELRRASLDPCEMENAYQVVADRIGISGAADDARAYTWAHLANVQPALPIDPTAARLLRAYDRKRHPLAAKGFHVGRPALALLTRDRGPRRASSRDDMEFYSDHGGSAWRAWQTIDALTTAGQIAYTPERFVFRFEEDSEGVDVFSLDASTGSIERRRCRTLVLAAGALGTARIAARSVGAPGARLPFLCSPYTYFPSVVPQRFGQAMPDRNIALSQLALFYDPDGTQSDVTMGQAYTYRSLLMFRLLRDVPLPVREARYVLRFLLSAFLIVGVFHSHSNDAGSSIWLENAADSPTGDRLVIDFRLTSHETAKVAERDRLFAGLLRRLGAYPIRKVDPGLGSSIHYAGTLPISSIERPLTTASDGRLHCTQRVFVADGSAFTYLPAKGLTLSLMARAHIVAKRAAQRP